MKLKFNGCHLFPLLGLIVLAFLSNRTGFDQWASALFYDSALQGFAWRDTPILSGLMHTGLKNLSVAIWIVGLLILLLTRVRPQLLPATWGLHLSSHQVAVTYMLLSALFASLLVAWLKSVSAHSCPWDLSEFGGQFSFFLLGQSPDAAAVIKGLGPGQCFPSGHASVGWMWMGAFFLPALYRGMNGPASARLVRLLQIAVILLGLTVSVVQVVRGAHFPSHVIATASVCWSVSWLCLCMAQAVYKPHDDL